MKNTNILLLAIAFAVSTLSNAQVIIDTFDNGMPNQLNAIDSLPPSIQLDGVNSFAVIPYGEVVRFVYEVQIPSETGLSVDIDMKHTFIETQVPDFESQIIIYVSDTAPVLGEFANWGVSKDFADIIRDGEWLTYTFEIPATAPNGDLPLGTAYVVIEIQNDFNYYNPEFNNDFLSNYELQVDNVVIQPIYQEGLTNQDGMTFYTTTDVLDVLADFTSSESVSYIEDSDIDGDGIVGVEDVVAMMPYYVNE